MLERSLVVVMAVPGYRRAFLDHPHFMLLAVEALHMVTRNQLVHQLKIMVLVDLV
jgi:hypothetical protein